MYELHVRHTLTSYTNILGRSVMHYMLSYSADEVGELGELVDLGDLGEVGFGVW
jgi:hypothetical protein